MTAFFLYINPSITITNREQKLSPDANPQDCKKKRFATSEFAFVNNFN